VTELAQRLKDRYFANSEHPYRTFERVVAQHLRPEDTLLDAGCGYTAPILCKFRGQAARLIGVDLVDFDQEIDGIELLRRDLASTGLADASVDVVMCRSVMEHLTDPVNVYKEMHRILRPGGCFIFLTGNLWDYAAIIARIIPNRFHPWIVAKVEGREERDVFPVAYKTNTRRQVERLCRDSGLAIDQFTYHGQYPSYFMFNGALFLIATWYEKLISRFEALRFLRGWILVVLRKPSASP
jgi:SAM-dependent methyltransferase